MASQNHYATLGVGSDASAEELRAQRRRLELAYHPDKFARDAEGQHSADAAVSPLAIAPRSVEAAYSLRLC